MTAEIFVTFGAGGNFEKTFGAKLILGTQRFFFFYLEFNRIIQHVQCLWNNAKEHSALKPTVDNE